MDSIEACYGGIKASPRSASTSTALPLTRSALPPTRSTPRALAGRERAPGYKIGEAVVVVADRALKQIKAARPSLGERC